MANATEVKQDATALQTVTADQVFSVLKANPEIRAAVYAIGTVVNSMPESLDTLMNAAFRCQSEYGNETKFREAFLEAAIIAQTKYVARNATVTWEALITKCQRTHKSLNYDQAVTFLLESPAKAQHALSEFGQAVIKRLR